MLKAEPLSVEEVNRYGGVGTSNNHVNMYVTTDATSQWYQKAVDERNTGYGGMIYYSSPTCGHVSSGNISTGCKFDYESSEIKYVLDAWAKDKFGTSNDYIVRLITFDELKDNLGYTYGEIGTSMVWQAGDSTPDWSYGTNYSYWTMSQWNDQMYRLWAVAGNRLANGDIYNSNYFNYSGDVNYKVRPVVEVKKDSI